jgi:CTP synthase (UTP-ammonia lyase)
MITKNIALIGDYNEHVVAHGAIPLALELVRKSSHANINWSWLETETLDQDCSGALAEFSAIWVVPGSPYKNMEGVLSAIRFARETGRPFLGTCGGFQHALIEYARNVCDIPIADHAETNPEGEALVVTPLTCSLVEKTDQIFFKPGSYLYSIFNERPTMGNYRCQYGLNAVWKTRLESAGLCFSGYDSSGEVRAFELPVHPFFIGVLFQPERSALQNVSHPLIEAFVKNILIYL